MEQNDHLAEYNRLFKEYIDESFDNWSIILKKIRKLKLSEDDKFSIFMYGILYPIWLIFDCHRIFTGRVDFKDSHISRSPKDYYNTLQKLPKSVRRSILIDVDCSISDREQLIDICSDSNTEDNYQKFFQILGNCKCERSFDNICTGYSLIFQSLAILKHLAESIIQNDFDKADAEIQAMNSIKMPLFMAVDIQNAADWLKEIKSAFEDPSLHNIKSVLSCSPGLFTQICRIGLNKEEILTVNKIMQMFKDSFYGNCWTIILQYLLDPETGPGIDFDTISELCPYAVNDPLKIFEANIELDKLFCEEFPIWHQQIGAKYFQNLIEEQKAEFCKDKADEDKGQESKEFSLPDDLFSEKYASTDTKITDLWFGRIRPELKIPKLIEEVVNYFADNNYIDNAPDCKYILAFYLTGRLASNTVGIPSTINKVWKEENKNYSVLANLFRIFTTHLTKGRADYNRLKELLQFDELKTANISALKKSVENDLEDIFKKYEVKMV